MEVSVVALSVALATLQDRQDAEMEPGCVASLLLDRAGIHPISFAIEIGARSCLDIASPDQYPQHKMRILPKSHHLDCGLYLSLLLILDTMYRLVYRIRVLIDERRKGTGMIQLYSV